MRDTKNIEKITKVWLLLLLDIELLYKQTSAETCDASEKRRHVTHLDHILIFERDGE
jgi:hypothetical protein